MIVSNPDLCTLTYFEIPSNTKRTNNMAESFHAHFNAHFYTTHPTIFVFLSRGQHTVVLHVVILLYDEGKWSLPGKFAHMNDLSLSSTGSILSNTDLSDLSTVGTCDIFVYHMRHRVMRFARLADSILFIKRVITCH